MMLVVVPSFICCVRVRHQKASHNLAKNDICGYCWSPLIWEATQISSGLDEGVLDCVSV